MAFADYSRFSRLFRSILKSSIVRAYCAGFLPFWLVRVLFRVLPLRGC